MTRCRFIPASLILALLVLAPSPARLSADEGMFPMSEILKLDLGSKGLAIAPEEIFSPDRASLIFAVVSVGATGSFVAPDGLFLTNHHVAFSAVQAASTPEKDYLTHGFLAKTRAEEIRAPGMTARITESFKDVSAEVLAAVRPGLSLADRTKAVEKKMKEIVAAAEMANPGKRAEVSEMFIGKSYVLFLYTFLKDIRLVFIPPIAIGNFGGEVDNWMWPRHTGDFSFLRAYVAPDGSPADFSPKNVPFKPKRYLRVEPAGVKEGDFMFLLGYPGRTYRHYTASYLAYEEDFRMPYVADWYGRQIDIMEKAGAGNPAVELKLAARIKSLANTMKNYRGKLAGMSRLQLTAARRLEETGLQKFIDADPQRKTTYGTVLEQTRRIYEEMGARARYEFVLDMLPQVSQLVRLGAYVLDASAEVAKPSAERQVQFRDDALASTRKASGSEFTNYHEPAERLFFRKMISLAAVLPEGQRIPAVDSALTGDYSEKNLSRYVDEAFANTTLKTAPGLAKAIGMSTSELAQLNDPFITLAAGLAPLRQQLREARARRDAELSNLSALLIDVKQKYLQRDFIPDANGTLRFTCGHVRGYSPADATYLSPISTLTGVMQKTKEEYPYATPQVVRDLYNARDFGRYRLPKANDLPVAVLYDTDTTGGNSGSPLMNAKGELVGVNFDRAWGATINDYAWNEAYSRSIAVDIRYVLWLTERVGNAKFLVKEMGIK